MKLSAEDRAAIEAIIGPRENKSLRDVLRDSLEHGVEYGLRAGLERAAKALECYDTNIVPKDAQDEHRASVIAALVKHGRMNEAFAAAIRALLDKD